LAKGALDYDDGKIDEAIKEDLAADGLRERIAADDDDLLFKSRLHLSDAYYFRQDYPAAENAVLPLLAATYTVDRVGAKNWGSARLSYASALEGRREFAQAERIQREVVDAWAQRLGRDHFLVGFAEECLADALANQDRWREAVVPARDATRIMRKVLGPNSQDARIAQVNLGNAEIEVGETHQAIADLQDALAALTALQGESDPQVHATRFFLSEALLRASRGREALQVIDKLDPKLLANAGVVDFAWETQLRAQRGRVLLEIGRRAEALPLLRSALAELEKAGARASQIVPVRAALKRAESTRGR
jgi:tetratricopeptide (TPR) repeat protein